MVDAHTRILLNILMALIAGVLVSSVIRRSMSRDSSRIAAEPRKTAIKTESKENPVANAVIF